MNYRCSYCGKFGTSGDDFRGHSRQTTTNQVPPTTKISSSPTDTLQPIAKPSKAELLLALAAAVYGTRPDKTLDSIFVEKAKNILEDK